VALLPRSFSLQRLKPESFGGEPQSPPDIALPPTPKWRTLQALSGTAYSYPKSEFKHEMRGTMTTTKTGRGVAGNSSPRNAVFQRGTFHEFHRNERLTVVFSHFMGGSNIGMVQRGSGAGFAAKALQGLRLARNVIW
jgi:hypothetical protein